MNGPPKPKKSPLHRSNGEGGKGVSGETERTSQDVKRYPAVKVQVSRKGDRVVIRCGRATR